jgi:hypothetical protein
MKIESLFAANESRFAAINSPTAGARVEASLPRGSKPFQLYSLATPNGQKVGILLEELGVAYDAHREIMFVVCAERIAFGLINSMCCPLLHL